MLHVYHPVAPSQEITVQPAGLQQCIKASQPLISLLLVWALWLPFFSAPTPECGNLRAVIVVGCGEARLHTSLLSSVQLSIGGVT